MVINIIGEEQAERNSQALMEIMALAIEKGTITNEEINRIIEQLPKQPCKPF